MKNATEFKQQIALLAAQFRAQIEAEVSGFEPDPKASAARVARAEHDYEYFAYTYFPHYCRAKPSVLHRYLFERLPVIAASRGQRDAIAAPRGEAKSTHVAMIFLAWLAVYRKSHYWLLIMDAFEQAAEMLEALKAELEANPRLLMDFSATTGQGRVWKTGVVITRGDMKIEAFGVGKRVRGRKHGPHRPDGAVLDDIENDENVRQQAQRDKTDNWIKRTVVPLGGADDSLNILHIGTVLHIDSVLARNLSNPGWRARRFKALMRMPDRMDLWDRWEETYLNTPGEPDEKAAAAHMFYAAHQKQMDAGAEISWPAMRSLEGLMIRRARDGHAAFDSELQNDPGAETKFFVGIQFWVDRLAEWVFYGACDPSLGKRGDPGSGKRTGSKGDPSAVLVGGYQRVTGTLDVIEASIARRLPLKTIATIIALQREYACVAWAFEAVQFQEFMRTQLIDMNVQQGVPVPARAVIPITEKELRIESLQPFVERGRIRLHPSQTTLHAEMKHYPQGEHDDGLDALHMLWMLAVTGGAAAGATVQDTQSHAAQRRRAGSMFGGRAAAAARRPAGGVKPARGAA